MLTEAEGGLEGHNGYTGSGHDLDAVASYACVAYECSELEEYPLLRLVVIRVGRSDN